MTLWRRILDWFTGGLTVRPEAVPVVIHPRAPATGPNWPKVADELALQHAEKYELGTPERAQAFMQAFPIPKPPPVADPKRQLAMDNAYNAMTAQTTSVYAWATSSMFGTGIGFYGFPYLSELQQRPEFRRPCEIIAQEMTRKWLKLTHTGEDKASNERLAKLDDAINRFRLPATIRRLVEVDGALGRAHLYVDTGDKGAERNKPLMIDKAKISVGSVKGFSVVEPTWVYPDTYNSTDPLALDFYKPQWWFVQGDRVHISRLMVYIAREVPDIVKPSYAFGGLSLAQMGKAYVDNWLRTRQSVSDITHSYSVWNLATNMASTMEQKGAAALMGRARAFTTLRDNSGLNVIDKETEELTNIAAPLTTLDKLQAQAQEQMASVFGIPLVKLLGVTPSGLNASSDGEIRAFYDWIHSSQEKLNPIIMSCLQIIQLNEFGDIDPAIGFMWEPLWQLDEEKKTTNRFVDAQADQIYITAGVISNEEVRARLARDDESGYGGLDPDDLPEPPEQPEPEPGDKPDAAA